MKTRYTLRIRLKRRKKLLQAESRTHILSRPKSLEIARVVGFVLFILLYDLLYKGDIKDAFCRMSSKQFFHNWCTEIAKGKKIFFRIRVIENMSHTEKITYFWTGLKCETSPQKKK